MIELFTLISIFANRGELLSSLHKILVQSSETSEGRKNLLPLEKALRCCGATLETATQYTDSCVAIGLSEVVRFI